MNLESSADKVVLIYDWAMSEKEHGALREVLMKIPGVRPVSISLAFLELCSNFDIETLKESQKLSNFWEKFDNYSFHYNGQYPEIFSNKHLLFQFERIKDEMALASNYGDVFEILLDLLNPKLIFFGHDSFTIESTLIRLANSRKIHTLSLVHGALRIKASMRMILGSSEVKLISCEKDMEWIKSYRIDKGLLFKIGSIGYEIPYKKYLNASKKKTNIKKRISKLSLGLRQDLPLIVMCTAEITSGLLTPVADPKKHRNTLREFVKLVKSRQDLQFIIKPHPGGGDYYKIYQDMLEADLPNLIVNKNLSLADALRASDVFFMLNYCTSAAIEAMLCRVPVIFLDSAIYKMDDWQDNLMDTGICRVSNVDELERVIDVFLSDHLLKEKALIVADSELKTLLGFEDSYPSQKLINLAKDFLDDGESNHEMGLRSSIDLDAFLSTTVQDIKNRHKLFNKKHSSKSLMYVLAYLCGNYNKGTKSLSIISEIICGESNNEKLQAFNKLKWDLHQAYLFGFFNRCEAVRLLDTLGTLRVYVFNISQFTLLPIWLKKLILKQLISSIFGAKALAPAIFIMRRMNQILKRFV